MGCLQDCALKLYIIIVTFWGCKLVHFGINNVSWRKICSPTWNYLIYLLFLAFILKQMFQGNFSFKLEVNWRKDGNFLRNKIWKKKIYRKLWLVETHIRSILNLMKGPWSCWLDKARGRFCNHMNRMII